MQGQFLHCRKPYFGLSRCEASAYAPASEIPQCAEFSTRRQERVTRSSNQDDEYRQNGPELRHDSTYAGLGPLQFLLEKSPRVGFFVIAQPIVLPDERKFQRARRGRRSSRSVMFAAFMLTGDSMLMLARPSATSSSLMGMLCRLARY